MPPFFRIAFASSRRRRFASATRRHLKTRGKFSQCAKSPDTVISWMACASRHCNLQDRKLDPECCSAKKLPLHEYARATITERQSTRDNQSQSGSKLVLAQRAKSLAKAGTEVSERRCVVDCRKCFQARDKQKQSKD